MKNGYIKLYRRILENGFLTSLSPEATKIFIWCLLKAAHKKHDFYHGDEKITLQPGEFITGRKKASEELNLSPQRFRTGLKKLKKLKFLTSTSTNKYTLISLINWGKYQDCNQQPNQQSNQSLTNTQPALNQHLTTYKNDKNDKNDKNNIKEKDIKKKKLFFSYELEKWENLDDHLQDFKKRFPFVNIDTEMLKMANWLLADKKRTKKSYMRFVTNWLNKALDSVAKQDVNDYTDYDYVEISRGNNE